LIELLRDEEAEVRAAAVEALGRLGDEAALEPLIMALADPDWRVRAGLGHALCSFEVERASQAALNVLVNPGSRGILDEGDLRARCQGILAINQLRDVRFSRKAIIFLFQFLDHEREPYRRIAEQTAMEVRHTRNGYHELVAILQQHNYPAFRRKAASWLGRFGIEAARPALAEAARSDPDPEVRRLATAALGASGR
jgi:HEAT repeat protein